MKRTLVLAILSPLLMCGCGDTVRAYLGTSTPTPTPPPTPVPKEATNNNPSNSGNWLFKDYQNPLDSHLKKKKATPKP
jgi:hypothetical protein